MRKSIEKYFKILRHIDPSMHRSEKFKKLLENSNTKQEPEFLLWFAIEIIKVQHDKIEELRKDMELT